MSSSKVKIGIFLPYTINPNQKISFNTQNSTIITEKKNINNIFSDKTKNEKNSFELRDKKDFLEKQPQNKSDIDEKNSTILELKSSSLSKSMAKYIYFALNSINRVQAYMVKIFEPELFVSEISYFDENIGSFIENSDSLELDYVIIFSVKIRDNMLTIKLSLVSKNIENKVSKWIYLYKFSDINDFYKKTVKDILDSIKYEKQVNPFSPTIEQILQLAEIIDEEDFFISSKKERSFIKKLSQLYVKNGDPLIFQYILEKLVFSDNIFFQNEIVEILEKKASTPHFSIMMTLFFMKKKNYKEAEAYFNKAKKELPDSDLVWQIGAETLFLAGKIKEAKKAIIKAVELNPLQLKTIELFVEISFSETGDLSLIFEYFLKKIPDFLKNQLMESPKVIFITAKNQFSKKKFIEALNLIEPISDKNIEYFKFYLKTLLSLKEFSKIYKALQNSTFDEIEIFKIGYSIFYKKSAEKIDFFPKIVNEIDFDGYLTIILEGDTIDEKFFYNYLLMVLKETPKDSSFSSREIEAIFWILLDENQRAVEILYNQPPSLLRDLTLGLLFYTKYDSKYKGFQFFKRMSSFEFSLSLIIIYHFTEKNLFRLWFYLKKREKILKTKDFFQIYYEIKLNIEIGNIKKGYSIFKKYFETHLNSKNTQFVSDSSNIYKFSEIEKKNSNLDNFNKNSLELNENIDFLEKKIIFNKKSEQSQQKNRSEIDKKNSNFDFDKFINRKLLENLDIFSKKVTLVLEIELEYLMGNYNVVIQKIQKGGFDILESKNLSYYVGKILVFTHKDSKGIFYLQNALKLDEKNKKLKKELEESYNILGFKNTDGRNL